MDPKRRKSGGFLQLIVKLVAVDNYVRDWVRAAAEAQLGRQDRCLEHSP